MEKKSLFKGDALKFYLTLSEIGINNDRCLDDMWNKFLVTSDRKWFVPVFLQNPNPEEVIRRFTEAKEAFRKSQRELAVFFESEERTIEQAKSAEYATHQACQEINYFGVLLNEPMIECKIVAIE